jgi:hypothetical protein
MDLSYSQFNSLMCRFPEFELSYETISHNKVSQKYDICLAIPVGKKVCAWFTFHEDKQVCYLFDLNRDKKISKGKMVPVSYDPQLALGTVVYGTLWEEECRSWFIVEDILYFKGITMKNTSFGDRLGYLHKLMEKVWIPGSSILFALSVMWTVRLEEKMWEFPGFIPASIQSNIAYPVHHIQYRSLTEVAPYLNTNINKKMQMKTVTNEIPMISYKPARMDLSKPQYKQKTIFQVRADVQYDIYHLYAYGKNNQPVYYGIAYIPDYKTSVFMNSLFRNIRENRNLDYIEESDDEDDFQDVRENKYVDLDKRNVLECEFHMKFKKWVPVRLVNSQTKVVHIFKLATTNDCPGGFHSGRGQSGFRNIGARTKL